MIDGKVTTKQILEGNVSHHFGISPTVEVTETEQGHDVTITDVHGKKIFSVLDGKDGKDGKDYVLTDQDKKDIAGNIARTKATAIITNASGETILTTDSANAPFVDMTVYGKSKQDGTPTIDNLIEIASHGDKGSIEYGVYGKNLYVGRYYNVSISSGKSYILNDNEVIFPYTPALLPS